MDKIKVYVKKPNHPVWHMWVDNTLESLQNLVDGYIEVFPIANDLVIICNEEGKILDLEPNCNVCGQQFVGTIIIAGRKKDEFTDCLYSANAMKMLFPQLWKG